MDSVSLWTVVFSPTGYPHGTEGIPPSKRERQLLANQPNAVIYDLRIGFPTMYRIGATDALPKSTIAGYSQ